MFSLNFGRRPSSPDPSPVALIVTSRQRLWQRHGQDGLAAIERAVRELTDAMALRGLQGLLVYADDSPLLGRLGVLPAEIGHAESVARMMRAVAGRLTTFEDEVRYVLLLGGDEVLPFARVANPSPDDEDDLASDHLYAVDPAHAAEAQAFHAMATEAGPNMVLPPTCAVGRIPDGSLEQLVNALRMAASAHRRLASGKHPRLKDEAWGYSASVWRRSARGAFAALGEPEKLRLSPPLTHIDLPHPGPEGPRFRYYNLHGLPDSAHWFGQRDATLAADYPLFPIALRPEDMLAAPGSVIFSAACFGAHLAGRAVSDSLALTALDGGALAFIGATGVAYGGLDGPLVAADLLAYRFWELLRHGAPAGVALARAKRAVMSEAIARQGYLDAEDEKTVQNFVLYGDPSLVHTVPATWSGAITEDSAVGFGGRLKQESMTVPDARGWQKSANGESATTRADGPSEDVSSHSPHSHRDVSERAMPDTGARRSLVDHVRLAVARRLPEFATCQTSIDLAPRAEVAVETEADRRQSGVKFGKGSTAQGGNGAVAKVTSGPSAAATRLVVTLSKTVQTAEGDTCREIMRVTVEPTGRIRKVALSR